MHELKAESDLKVSAKNCQPLEVFEPPINFEQTYRSVSVFMLLEICHF